MTRNFSKIKAKEFLSGLKEVTEFSEINLPLNGMKVIKNNIIYEYYDNNWIEDISQFITYDDETQKLLFTTSAFPSYPTTDSVLTINGTGHIDYTSISEINSGSTGGGGPEFFYFNFTKNTNNKGTGFFSDAYIILGWDGYDELFIRQPTTRSNVYASNLVNVSGSFPSNQSMILSTTDNDYFQSSSTARVEFTISSDVDNTHPFYKIRFHISTSSGTDYVYCTIEKYT